MNYDDNIETLGALPPLEIRLVPSMTESVYECDRIPHKPLDSYYNA